MITKTLHIKNDLSQLSRLNEFLEEIKYDLNIPDPLLMSIHLAIEEAIVNVISYAYPGEKDKEIELDIKKTDDKLTFTLIDSGIYFDPTGKVAPDITLSAEERPIGGLGIHLVKKLMNEVNYTRYDDKNILTMIKQLS